jgi:muramidase (phage lysozyme)
MSPNLKAFLDMISVSEGTKGYGDDGYNVLVGCTLFEGYADHPRKLVNIRPGLASTAAGRYQLLARYFDAYKKQLGLPDFGHESQDAIAIQQIKECKALPDIEAGYIDVAIAKCAHIWASLPGAGYGQHENSQRLLISAYQQFGGSVIQRI